MKYISTFILILAVITTPIFAEEAPQEIRVHGD